MDGIQRTLPTIGLCLALASVVALLPANAGPIKLRSVHYPEKQQVQMDFAVTSIAPSAHLTTDILYRQGQARIELTFNKMKPAILFGGDVTCYVVWAVTRDGRTENLGELVTPKQGGKLKFSTGKKDFALMITAEPYYLVNRPSQLVVFYNNRSRTTGAESKSFQFTQFAAAPEHHADGIAHLLWDSKVPLELLQARKAYELATRVDSKQHAAKQYREAGAFLASANRMAKQSPKNRELLDLARRSVTLSNEALNRSMQRIEAIESEKKLAARRAETAALEQRAAEAEAAAETARLLAEEVRAERERMATDTAAMREEKRLLESAMFTLRAEKETALQDKSLLEVEASRMQRERDELNARLQSALSHVADTQQGARGFVVNLPDILFDVNQDTLRPEAQIVLAKLAGILLIIPDQDALVEGHTDATGDDRYNLDLSRRRARSVTQFLQLQGLEPRRLQAVGYGIERPVAGNETAAGRKRNRRVEIVISRTEGRLEP